jgi:pilus assembly protein Flp/PilA
MAGRIWTFVRNDSGATAIEYALIAGLLALAVILPLANIGVKLSGYFSEASSALK